MRYKFFSTKYMTKGHLDALKKSRKVPVTEKVMHYDGGAFLEHMKYEKALYVYPKDDAILKELDELDLGENGEYDYKSLSSEFKKYMRLKDDEFFNKAFSEWKFSREIELARQERAIDNLEDYYDRELFEDELIDILSGDKPKIEKPVFVKARNSSRRAYKTVIELIRANLDKFETFITLTFARKEHEEKYLEHGANFELLEDVKDFEMVKKVFSKFINTLTKNMKRKGKDFKYIAVYEQHRDGSYHFHLIASKVDDEYLIDCPEWLDTDYKVNKRRYGKMIEKWVYGKSDVEQIRDKEKMSTYLCKYLIKNFMGLTDTEELYEEYLGKKKYFCSKGLSRPEVEYIKMHDIEKIEILEKRKAEYSDKYSTSYKNYYSDSQIEKTICSKIIS